MPDSDALSMDVFHFDGDRKCFDDMCQHNGITFWWWSEVRAALGLSTKLGDKALSKAMTTCTSIGANVQDSFVPQNRTVDGYTVPDYKLSRFACYLIAMNADPRRPEVAKAQAYFALLAETVHQVEQLASDVERVNIRSDVVDGERTLSGTAKRHGVENYAFFQSAGYRGLYNMSIAQLRSLKGVPAGRSPLDFMAREELAANLFRITQTEANIRNSDVRGQLALERSAEQVGKRVRQVMRETSGTLPETLAPAADIRRVRAGIKQSKNSLDRIDQPKKRLGKPKPKRDE